jgi:hypothetical protein
MDSEIFNMFTRRHVMRNTHTSITNLRVTLEGQSLKCMMPNQVNANKLSLVKYPQNLIDDWKRNIPCNRSYSVLILYLSHFVTLKIYSLQLSTVNEISDSGQAPLGSLKKYTPNPHLEDKHFKLSLHSLRTVHVL